MAEKVGGQDLVDCYNALQVTRVNSDMKFYTVWFSPGKKYLSMVY